MSQIDAVRAFWDARPCNLRHGTAPVGTKEYFDQVEARRYFVEPHIPAFADFERWRGKKVLEIGCGIGTDAINFARAGADVTVVELSKESLDLCRRRFRLFGLDANFYLGNVEELTTFVPVETYDLVYSFGVLHHTPDPERALAEIVPYMAADSELRAMFYAARSTKAFAIRLGLAQPEAQAGCPIATGHTARSIRGMMEPLGYDVESISKRHIFPYDIPRYVKHKYVERWQWRWMPWPLFRLAERLLGWHLLVIARLDSGM